MRNFIWTLGALAALGTLQTAQAQQASKEEAIGIGTGGVIGAVAGGPVGFIVGSAIGAKIGDKMHDKNDKIDGLSSSLEQSRESIDGLKIDVRALSADLNSVNGELEQLERVAHPELVSLLQAGIEMDLLFHTGEYQLPASHRVRLQGFADALAAMANVQVHLDGFADERGDAAYNQALSERRVSYVRDQLLSAGLDPSRISDAAHGEVPAEDPTIDSMALERRVSLKVFIDDSLALAANPR